MNLPERPITILIAALGGEGGGVMADWLMEAATHSGYPAQATSIPGVAQRTGATTYYLEIFPVQQERAGRQGAGPLAHAQPRQRRRHGRLRAGRGRARDAERLRQPGAHHADRLHASHLRHGREDADGRRPLRLASACARPPSSSPRRAVLFDMRKLAQESGTVINAVLFGAMAGSGVLPLTREACEQAIRHGGRGAEASLRGFAAGYDIAARPAPGAGRAGDTAARHASCRKSCASAWNGCRTTRATRYAALYEARMKPFLGGDEHARRGGGAPPRAVDGLRGHHPRRRPEDARVALRARAQGSRREGRRAGGGDRLPQAGRRGVRLGSAPFPRQDG